MGNRVIKVRLLAALFAAACVLWPETTQAQSPIRGLHADRFDVALTLLPDGSVDVRETVVFRFTEKTFTRVEREIPIRRFDDVIDVRASLDGQPLSDEGSERVRIRRGRNTLRVTWNFADTIDKTRTFTLEYRAMGVLAVANGRATMDWTVLPSRHRYVIDQARVEWRVPSTVVRLEPTAIDDPRWVTEALPDGWAATRASVGLDETVRLTDAFELSSMAVTVPEWQTNSFRARQMAPAFVVSAVTLLFSALGVIGMTWFRYHVPKAPPVVEPARADTWPPAIGTSLVRGAVPVGMPQVQATLLDLARRGAIQIAESRDQEKRFDVVMPRPQSHPTRAHERAVLDTLWLHMKDGRMDLRTAWKQLMRSLPAFRRSLLAEMQEAGLVDPERRWAVRAMVIAGIVVSILGIAGVVLFRVLFGHLGDVPQVVPGSVVLSGFAFLVASQCLSVLSPAGVAAAAEWRARRRWIKESAKGAMSASDIARWFPAAAGFGLAQPLLKSGESALVHGAAAFEWLGPVRHPGAALAVIIASTPTGSHYGGGSVGGSAAGGSSSAS
jgi:hypothetical protein